MDISARIASFIFSFLSVFMTISCVPSAESGIEDDLVRLDRELENASEYVRLKEQKISTISNLLNSRGVTPLQQYQIYGQLYREYVAFQFDKAKEMLEHQIRLADEMNNAGLKNSAMIDKAMLYVTAGLYLEADHVFSALDTTTFNPLQKTAWYDTRQKFLTDYDEYVSSCSVTVPDVDKIQWYQDQVLAMTSHDDPVNRHLRVMKLVSAENYEEAYRENSRIISVLDRNSRDYAVSAYWQGYICDHDGRPDEAVRWWIESAICDIHGAIKDNASLCTIATKLTDTEESDRAFSYIRISLEDALFYNAKLRKVQIASTLPWIEQTYLSNREEQSRRTRELLTFISVIAVILAAMCVISVRLFYRGRRASAEIRRKNLQLAEYSRSVEDAEDNLRQANMRLVEANEAKEEYLGLFLSMSSGYLDKLRKTLPRDQYDMELKTFYKTFDTSFLQLYPTFVEEFNALLREDARITLKEGELLSTELRIFALIKLGITQSSHIASLLRYSVNTIYNYRAQVKNSVLEDRDNFEAVVKKIGSKR